MASATKLVPASDTVPAPEVSIPTAPDPAARQGAFRLAFDRASMFLASAGTSERDGDMALADLATLGASKGCTLALKRDGVTIQLGGGTGVGSAFRFLIGARDAGIPRSAWLADIRKSADKRTIRAVG